MTGTIRCMSYSAEGTLVQGVSWITGYLPAMRKEVHEAARSERTKSCCSRAVTALDKLLLQSSTGLNERCKYLGFLNDFTQAIIPINTLKQTSECVPSVALADVGLFAFFHSRRSIDVTPGTIKI